MKRETVIGLMLAALILVGGFATAVRTTEDLRASCERGNVIREQVSDRAVPIRRSLVVLIESRERGGSISSAEGNGAAKREAEQLRRELNAIREIPQVDCDEVVRSPWPL